MAGCRSGYKEVLCSQATDCIDNPLGDKAINPGDTATILGDNLLQIGESSVEPATSLSAVAALLLPRVCHPENGATAAGFSLSFRAGNRPEQAASAADRPPFVRLGTL
jgi:hypothetical protein